MANNPTRKEYIEAAKAAFLNLAIKQAISVLTKEFAFLAWGPAGVILEMLVTKILQAAVEKGEVGIFFVFIDFRVGDQESKFSAAALLNYHAQVNGTKEEKDEAERKLIEAFDDFVKFNRY